MSLGWLNPTISRALVVPADSFYIQYDEGKGECVLGYTAYQVSFDVNVLRIEGHPCVLTDVALRQDGQTTRTLRRSGANLQLRHSDVSTVRGASFSVFLGYSDQDHKLYLDVSTVTGLLEYQMVEQPSHTLSYFWAFSSLMNYIC